MKRFLAALALLTILLPGAADAQQVSYGAEQVAGPLIGFFTSTTGVVGLNDLAYLLMTKFWLLIGVAATYNIVRAGIRLINSQEEDKVSKARRTIGMSLVAVMAAYLAPKLVEAIYTAGGIAGVFASPGGVFAGAGVFANELYGIIRWIEVMLIPLAIALIVFSGLKAILTFGKEDGPAALRREVLAVGVGLILLILDPVIKATLGIPNFGLPGTPSTAPLITRGIAIVNNLILLLALLATAIAIYAGIRMIVSLGNEEAKTAAKNLLVRTAIGMAILFLSYALIGHVIHIVST